jgi:hypothetical protein
MSGSTTFQQKQDIRVVAADLKRIDKNGVRASFTCYFPDLDLHVRGCLWGVRADGKEWIGLVAALAAVHELAARAS